ncbi:UNKNOWN [Stylonychia lemnae]|uniref:Uncharacterized protein n=1 Tax=Stylonychia lemnae TaxID=5949 RepID=A0A078B5B8_STYLE|nr:UNKNOWN [Stylonychia lemnae]|eukprot:CDW89381.1 UNKNOWN [Stylonychia lemnae]
MAYQGVNPELIILVDQTRSYKTLEKLDILSLFLEKNFSSAMRSQNAKRMKQTHSHYVLDQYLVNEFFHNLPLILRLLFPSHQDDGWFAEFQNIRDQLLGDKFDFVQMEWCDLVNFTSKLMDLYQIQLANVCLEYQNFLRISANSPGCLSFNIDDILPMHTRMIIQAKQFEYLPTLYHNLTEQIQLQRTALDNLQIILNPWEQFVMHFMRSMAFKIDYTQPFVNSLLLRQILKKTNVVIMDETAVTESRLDYQRVMTINFTRLLASLIDERYKLVYQQRAASFQFCDQFVLAFEEYIMNPLIHYELNETTQLNTTKRYRLADKLLCNTQHLESAYIFISLLQNIRLQFNTDQYQTHLVRNQFINDQKVNYLIELKGTLYKYFKTLFKIIHQNSNESLIVQNQLMISQSFRANKVADVAKLWLQMLRPWDSENQFIQVCLSLNRPDDDNFLELVDEKGRIDLEVFNILSHTSIPSLTKKFDIRELKTVVEREEFRALWENYITEFQVFYFDLFVDYLVAIIKQGVYTVEDIVVFNDVMEIFGIVIEEDERANQDAEMISLQSGSSNYVNPYEGKNLYIIDGILTSDKFCYLTKTYFNETEFREYYPKEEERNDQVKAFIEQDFWKLLKKAFTKLKTSDIPASLHPLIKESMKSDQQILDLLNDSETKIVTLECEFQDILTKGQNQSMMERGSIRNKEFSLVKHGMTLRKQYMEGGVIKDQKINQTYNLSSFKQGQPEPLFKTKDINRTTIPSNKQGFLLGEEPSNLEPRNLFDRRMTQPINKTNYNLRMSPTRSLSRGQQPSLRQRGFTRFEDESEIYRDYDEISVRQSKGKNQPRQSLRRINKEMTFTQYKGNQWDKPLGKGEYRIIYYSLMYISYFIDWVMKVKTERRFLQMPQSQFLRQFVEIYALIRMILYTLLCYFLVFYVIFKRQN